MKNFSKSHCALDFQVAKEHDHRTGDYLWLVVIEFVVCHSCFTYCTVMSWFLIISLDSNP